MLDLAAVLESTEEFAPLPATVTRLIALLTQPDVDLRTVAEVIALDEALMARLLRTANSAMYASQHPITTVRAAVVRLGSGIALSYAIGAGAKKSMQRALPQYGMIEGALWRHSVAAALAAEVIRAAVRIVRVPEEAYSSALLHDIGKLVLARYLSHDVLEPLMHARTAGHLSQVDAESMLLGINHGELGEAVGRRWKLPSSITLPIRYLHHPGSARDDLAGEPDAEMLGILSDVVHLADQVALQVRPTDSSDEPGGTPDGDALQRLGLDVAAFANIMGETRTKFEETLRLYE